MGKSAPAPPDYTAAANASADASKEVTNMQTWANRADQKTPWGSTTWGATAAVDPSTGQPVTKWTQNTSVDPKLQGALDSQLGLQSARTDLASSLMPRAQQEFGQAMDWSSLTPWSQGQMNSQAVNPTTSAYSFGNPQAQNIETRMAATPQLNTDLTGSAGQVQRGLDYSGLQDVQGSAQQRQRAEDAIYKSATSRLDPQWQGQQTQLETQLANQGITRNSAAYENAMAGFNRQKTDAYQQAQLGSVTGAGQVAQQNYGMDLGLRQQQATEQGQLGQFGNAAQQQYYNQLTGNNAALGSQQQMFNDARAQQLQAQQTAFQQQVGAGQYGMQQQQQAFGQQQAASGQNFSQQLQANQYQNQMRQQQLVEQMQQRGFSLNEMNAIISGQQVQTPQFSGYNTSGVSQAQDFSKAQQNQYGAEMDAYNANQQQTAGYISAAASAAAMAFSDARVKRDIRRIGTHPRGFGIYRYRYIGERGSRVGVIAQDVRRFAPELVGSMRGVLMVNYAAL